MQKKAKFLAVGEGHLTLLESRCRETVCDGRYCPAEIWEDKTALAACPEKGA